MLTDDRAGRGGRGRFDLAGSTRGGHRAARRHETGTFAARYCAIEPDLKEGALFMKSLIGAAVIAPVMAFAGPAAVTSAAAAPHMKAQTAGASNTTDISARRYHRHYGYGYYRRYD